MSHGNFWSRLRKGRLFQVLLFYLGVSWVVLQVVGELRETLDLPKWIGPVTLILLVVGLIIILATAWVQSHPLVDARERADEVPGSWEVDLPDAIRSVRKGRLPHLTWSRAIGAGVAAFVLLFIAVGAYVKLSGGRGLGPSEAVAEAAPDGIAVLPFSARGAAIADWREGMVDLLSTDLDGAGGLRAITSSTVLSRWHEMVRDSAEADERTALDVARRLGARYAMLGTAVAIGPSVRLTVRLHELDRNGARSLGQVQVQGPPDSVLALVDSLSFKTLSLLLRGDPAELPRVDLASVTTASLPALKAYLEGESLFRQGQFEEATEPLSRAVALDSTFGLAWYRLAESYGWDESIASERGGDASDRALALVDRLPERVATLVRADAEMRHGDPTSVSRLQDAVRKYPDDAEAWYLYGDAQLHVRQALRTWDDAEDAFERAVELAPRFAPYRIHLIDAAFRYHADSALVHRRVAEFARLAPESPKLVAYRVAERLAFGDDAQREAALQEMRDSAGARGMGPTVSQALSHPRFFDVAAEPTARLGLEVAPPPARPQIRLGLAGGLASKRGKLRDALEILEDESLPVPAKLRMAFTWHAAGLPVPDDRLEALTRDSRGGEVSAAIAATFAAEHGQTQQLERFLSRARQRADSLLAAGDSAQARTARASAGVLHGYVLWRTGKVEDAIRELEANRVAANIPPVTFWLGVLELQVGRPREAIPYLRSLMAWTPDPLVAYYLGQAYMAQGEDDQARQMLAFFVENWKDADPELQPLVQDARSRLQRLAPDRGG